MRKLIFAFLAILTVFAMVSCNPPITTKTEYTVTFNGNGAISGTVPAAITAESGSSIALPANTGDLSKTGFIFGGWSTTPTGVAIGTSYTVAGDITLYAVWTFDASASFVTFSYQNGTFQQVPVNFGETQWSDVLIALPAVKRTDTKAGEWIFAYWKDQTGTKWDTAGTVINSGLLMTAHFYSTAFSGDTAGAVKVYLENSSYVVFEFDVGENVDVTKIKGIKADYGLSEKALDIYKGNGRPWRAFGPYFYNGTSIQQPSTTRNFYGDFMIDGGKALVGRFEGSASLPKTFNKFHPYMCYSNGSWNSSEVSAEPTANTWFTTTYNFSSADDSQNVGSGAYTYGKTLRLLNGVLTNGQDDGVQVLPANTLPTQKVYFAIGITRANAGQGGGKSGLQSPWDHGIVSLVKNVKLIYGDTNAEKAGVIPTLQAGTESVNQVFVGYVDPINFGWTGAPNAPVVIKQDPAYVPPAEGEATENFVVNNPALTLYQNDEAKSPDGRKRITIVNNVITFDIQTDDYNDGAGLYGGGGFQILFAGISLPEAFTAYKKIVLNCTITGSDIAGKQVIFSAPGGANVSSVVNNGGSPGTYINMANGTNVFSFATTALASGASGVAVRANNWSSGNVPIIGAITVNSITFSIDP